MEEIKQYYGEREINSIGQENSDGLISITFKDGTKEELSKLTITSAVTDKPLDATALRDRRCFPVVAEILKVLLNANVHIDEIDYITQRVIMSINESCKVGNEKLWGATEDEKTMIHVQRVLMLKVKKEIPSPYNKV